MDFFQKALTPPPDFWNFWDTFLYADFSPGTFGAIFVLYFTKIRVKSVQKLLDLVNPPKGFDIL